MTRKLVLIVALLVFAAAPAWADVFNVRPVAGLPLAGTETPLQTIFQNIGSTINVANQESAAIFEPESSLQSAATLVVEIAGNKDTNSFGLYQYGNPSLKVEVWSGADSAVTKKTIYFDADDMGGVQVNSMSTIGTLVPSFGFVFGFYLTTGSGVTFYSEDSLNGYNPQAFIYRSIDTDRVNVYEALDNNPGCQGLAKPCLSDFGHYYVAFEDLAFANTDKDYNDFLAQFESIMPVPEPGSMLLLGTGLIGLAGIVRRRFKK